VAPRNFDAFFEPVSFAKQKKTVKIPASAAAKKRRFCSSRLQQGARSLGMSQSSGKQPKETKMTTQLQLPAEAKFFDQATRLKQAVTKLLPYAEAEQENFYHMAKQEPDEYQSAYEECRHAVSFAYDVLGDGAVGQPKPAKKRKTRRNLPPDPENMNGDRAEWAAAALRHFQCCTGTDYDDSVTDLLGDLMHWCDRNGVDFGDELARARRHYHAETDGKGAAITLID
jgi:hypothetical protein